MLVYIHAHLGQYFLSLLSHVQLRRMQELASLNMHFVPRELMLFRALIAAEPEIKRK